MSAEQRKVYVAQKAEERRKIQNEIQALNKKRQEYNATHNPIDNNDSMLDAAMIKAIREKARTLNFVWK